MSNVVEVVGADVNLTTMLRGVKAAGLDTVLSQRGPFTIFAPTDLGFSKLDAGRMAQLLKEENKEKLTELLNHHIVEGLTNFKDLQDGQKLVTTNGRELKVKVADGIVTINGAIIQRRDGNGTNGVVHTLDAVIEMK
jgi:uncharacterized surface protein with fasciclin (FAS1) repeats